MVYATRGATGLATAVADGGGAGTVTLDHRELLGRLAEVRRAVEAGQGAQALDLIADLMAWVGAADAGIAPAGEGR